YFLAYDPDLTEHLPIEDTLDRVAASLVTPYPPGFPVLVPGQIVSKAILDYLLVLDNKEVHGLHPEFGMRVFCEEALQLENKNSTHKEDSK
ncbi:MAG: arginine decarboxylase, partial [Myxococcota bacterium]